MMSVSSTFSKKMKIVCDLLVLPVSSDLLGCGHHFVLAFFKKCRTQRPSLKCSNLMYKLCDSLFCGHILLWIVFVSEN